MKMSFLKNIEKESPLLWAFFFNRAWMHEEELNHRLKELASCCRIYYTDTL